MGKICKGACYEGYDRTFRPEPDGEIYVVVLANEC